MCRTVLTLWSCTISKIVIPTIAEAITYSANGELSVMFSSAIRVLTSDFPCYYSFWHNSYRPLSIKSAKSLMQSSHRIVLSPSLSNPNAVLSRLVNDHAPTRSCRSRYASSSPDSSQLQRSHFNDNAIMNHRPLLHSSVASQPPRL